MKFYNNPAPSTWIELCKRPQISSETLDDTVKQIINQVKANGDEALKTYTLQFDKIKLESLKLSEVDLVKSIDLIDDELKRAIATAYENIKKFHQAQLKEEDPIETTEGVICWRKSIAIEKVGLYIPGGSAPLFSTILMLAIPAIIAGCKEIILCTPCDKNGIVNPAILYTAQFLGIQHVYKIGGAQAIAAMAYGTETIPQVNKIFGPGNQYVTKAKELVQQAGVAIDMPAGPSEVLIIADQNADADFIAADLLAQAEHGTDSQVVLLADNEEIIFKVQNALITQLEALPRKALAQKTLENSFAIVLNSIEACLDFSNTYAPEHLILSIDKYEDYVDKISNAGLVFLGKYTCESAGDYASGTNHTLPTNGFAKSYSGVSVDSFVKKITYQTISENGLKNLGSTIEIMAEAEQLFAHKNAVSIRLKKLNNEI